MPMEPLEDGLLQPTLTEADDAVGFAAPWNPVHLVLLSFFFGLPVGGALAALNYRRLGWQQRVAPTLALIILLSLGVVISSLMFLEARGWELDDDDKLWSRTAHRVFAILVTGAIALQQRRRFRLAVATGQEMGRLFMPALIAFLVGGGISLLLGLIGIAILKPA